MFNIASYWLVLFGIICMFDNASLCIHVASLIEFALGVLHVLIALRAGVCVALVCVCGCLCLCV